MARTEDNELHALANQRSEDKPLPAPRTDAIITGGTIGQNALLEHARQLERELAEAHRRAEAFKEAMHSYEEAARVERDSARSARATTPNAALALLKMWEEAAFTDNYSPGPVIMEHTRRLIAAADETASKT